MLRIKLCRIRLLRYAAAGLALLTLVVMDARASSVKIHEGWVNGRQENGISRYLGIPYARPPVGALRWAPPQDPLPWAGVRQADAFASACAQFGNFYTSNDPATFDRPYGSEDCLYLNVWAPSAHTRKRPVVVFIHGGSGIHGAASLSLYDGQRLAQELGAVVISINYRLSLFGNMHLPALHNGDPIRDSGSFALLDQIKALEWVRRNAASFGGDPTNVTVMGQSAGCVSIWALLRSPLASGKFHKVICLSGIPLQSAEEELREPSMELLSRLLQADRQIDSRDGLPAWLRGHTAAQIREYLYGKSTLELIRASRGIRNAPEGVDGYVVSAGVEGPLVNPVPAIIGSTRNEATLLLLKNFSPLDFTSFWSLIHGDQENLSQGDFFSGPFDLLKYKLSAWFVNRKLLGKVDDSADLLAAHPVPVYRYEFHWDHMPKPWESLLGAYHGLDLPFIFGNFDRENPNFTHFSWAASDDDELESLHKLFVDALRGFIESANPNQYSPDLNWPEWGKQGNKIKIP